MTATPSPAATRPWIVGLSFERNAQCGSMPAPRNAATIGAAPWSSRKPISGRSATSRKRRTAVGGRRGCRDDHDVGIAKQLDRLERRIGHRQLDEADVDLAGLDRADDAVVLELVEHHVDLGPLLGEPPHDLGEQPGADRLERADAQGAGLAGAEGVEVGLGRPQPPDDRVGMAQQEHAGFGQRDGAGPAGPFDEPLADDPLERRHLLADRRLRVAEPFGGATERPLVGDRAQRREVAELDAEPTISFHNET